MLINSKSGNISLLLMFVMILDIIFLSRCYSDKISVAQNLSELHERTDNTGIFFSIIVTNHEDRRLIS